MGWSLGCSGGGLWGFGRASGGAGGRARSGAPGLIEVVFNHGFPLGGIELGRLIEVVGEVPLGGMICFSTGALYVELRLGWFPGGMKRRRLPDVNEDSGDGLGVGEVSERNGDHRRVVRRGLWGEAIRSRREASGGLDRSAGRLRRSCPGGWTTWRGGRVWPEGFCSSGVRPL